PYRFWALFSTAAGLTRYISVCTSEGSRGPGGTGGIGHSGASTIYTFVYHARMTSERPTGSHRDRLLAAALTCLQDRGYAHTTARDLVAASGTNLRSIGYHFGSKEALLDEALGECFRIWTSRVEQAVFEIRP